MLAPAIHQGGNRPPTDHVEAPADQREALGSEVAHRDAEVDLALEPRFHRVLVGGDHVRQVPGLQRAQVGVDDLTAGIGAALDVRGGRHGNARRRGHQRDLTQQPTRETPARRGGLAHAAQEPVLEAGRRIEARQPLSRGLSQRKELVLLPATSSAAADVGLELGHRTYVELVVHPGTDQTVCLGASHALSFSPATMSARSCARARDSRDITVPMGTPATSAISL